MKKIREEAQKLFFESLVMSGEFKKVFDELYEDFEYTEEENRVKDGYKEEHHDHYNVCCNDRDYISIGEDFARESIETHILNGIVIDFFDYAIPILIDRIREKRDENKTKTSDEHEN